MRPRKIVVGSVGPTLEDISCSDADQEYSNISKIVSAVKNKALGSVPERPVPGAVVKIVATGEEDSAAVSSKERKEPCATANVA